MTTCIFPGSFDPITKGHLDLISRASEMFDHVTVTVMNNIHKNGAIPVKNRVELIRKACEGYRNVTVEKWDKRWQKLPKMIPSVKLLRGLILIPWEMLKFQCIKI